MMPTLPDAALLGHDEETSRPPQPNPVWERTQQSIALAVTIVTLIICGMLVYKDGQAAVPAFMLLSNAFFLVIGTYFQRTSAATRGARRASDQPVVVRP